jgi:serine/threonine protein kinase, bacterial
LPTPLALCLARHRLLASGAGNRRGAKALPAQLAKTAGVDPSVINCIKAGEDVATAKAKAEAGDATLSGLNATGTPFVWDGTKGVNYQNPSWLTKLIG